MLKHSYICFILSICTFKIDGQELRIGDELPDIVVENVFNYTSNKIKLSDFRGRLVILDFWDVSCISCLKAFPKMDSLQKVFGDRIQIVLVNRQTIDSTKNFFAKRKKLLQPHLPMVTSDSVLNKLFPHSGEPFHVWIDKTGIVRYTTDAYNASVWRINDFLSGEDVTIEPAFPQIVYINSFIDQRWKASLEYYSYLSHWKKGIHLGPSENIPGYIQLIIDNLSVVDLYKIAYSEITKYDFDRPGRVILELKDEFKYVRPGSGDKKYDEWLDNYSYNYHLFLTQAKKDNLFKFMRQDLERLFDIDAKIERRKIKCFALIRTSKKDRLKTKGGLPQNTFIQSDIRSPILDFTRSIINQPFKTFSSRLETIIEYNFSMPFIDATAYTGNIDFEISGEILDSITIADLKKELVKYGLNLIEKYWSLEVLVLKERK